MRFHGLDISHWQQPHQMPWDSFAKTSQFVIARGTYGTNRDRAVAEHVRRARGVGLRVGLYHFYRQVEPWKDQFEAFGEACDAAGIRPGDIIPALDLEDDGQHRPISADWAPNAWQLCEAMVKRWGDCLVYITQRDFGRLGRPEWVLQRPLWVAHWTAAKQPATPGNAPWAVWQYRVGPYQAGGVGGYHEPAKLDHNWADRLVFIPEPARPSEPTELRAPPGGIYDEEAGVCRPADTDPAPPPGDDHDADP